MAWWDERQQQEAQNLAAAAGLTFHSFSHTGTAFRPVTVVEVSPHTTENTAKVTAFVALLDDKFTEENDARGW